MFSPYLSESIETLDELSEYIDISPEERGDLEIAIRAQPLKINKYYLSLIDRDDPNDPIRRMSVPSVEELDPSGYSDTSGEAENTQMPGLQHKYNETVLVLSTNQCAIHCRYCFRKRLVGLPTDEIVNRFDDAVKYIREHPEVTNVLISGGDPLVLTTDILRSFLDGITDIPHVKFIRFGTRVPVTSPSRVTDDGELIALLKKHSRKDRRIYVVTHFNHTREITEQAVECANQLIESGAVLLNQTVLLGGVNDDGETLAELQRQLTAIGVSPYYLFQRRPVKRVTHFEVPIARGYEVVADAKRVLSGPSKQFRYVMSHRTGKIEIVGVSGDEVFLRFHQAKDPNDAFRSFRRKLTPDAAWLDDLPPIEET